MTVGLIHEKRLLVIPEAFFNFWNGTESVRYGVKRFLKGHKNTIPTTMQFSPLFFSNLNNFTSARCLGIEINSELKWNKYVSE